MCAIWVSTHCCNPEDFPQWRGNCVNATWNTDDSYPNTLEPNFFLKNKIFDFLPLPSRGLPWWLSWLRICLQCGTPGSNPWVGKIPWRREQLPTPVFWTGELHGLYIHGVAKSWTRLGDFHFHFTFLKMVSGGKEKYGMMYFCFHFECSRKIGKVNSLGGSLGLLFSSSASSGIILWPPYSHNHF